MLVLALFSKFEIFKTFLNKKIRTLTQFFYFNRSAINFCAHTRKTCEQKIWTIQKVFSSFYFTKKAQMPTELLIAEFWWNKSRTNLICDMCVTCKSPDMWTPDICKLHTNCALFVRKLYANCTLLLHVFCISCVFRTLSCTLSLVFKNQRMLMKKNWVTCKTTYHGQKKFKIIYILHTWKLCDFFDNSPVGFAIVDGDGSYLVEQQ